MKLSFTVLVERTAKWLCVAAAVGALAACGGGEDQSDEPMGDEQAQPAAANPSREAVQGITVLNRTNALRPSSTPTR
jgi:uncharacterized lipoprotein